MSALDENEEFEFRMRAEQEAAAKPAVEPHVAGGAESLLAGADVLASGASHAVTGAISPVAGLIDRVAGALGLGVPDLRGFVESMVYQPQTEGGKAFAGKVSHALEPVGKVMNKIDTTAHDAMGGAAPFVEEGLGTLNDLVGTAALGGGVLSGARASADAARMADAAAAAKPKVPIGTSTTKAIDNGWILRPSDVSKAHPGAPDVPGVRRQALQNQGKFHTESVRANQAKSTKMGGEEIGIENATEFTDEAIDALKAPHNKNYETAGKAAGPKFADSKLKGRLDAIVKGISPEDGQQKAIRDIADVYDPDAMSGPSLVQSVQKLRRDGSRGMRSTVVREQNIGEAKRAIAQALEDGLTERVELLGDKQVITALKSSRETLAKIHNVEDSLTGKQLDPQKLKNLRDKKGAPLSGKLDEIADMAADYPDVVRSSHGTSVGGGIAHSQTGWKGKVLGATLARVPGLDVNTPGFRQKIAATGKAQQAAAGETFNRVNPIKPVESNQGRQTDMIGPNLDLAAPAGEAGLTRPYPQLGDQIEALGPVPTEELALQAAPGKAPGRVAIPEHPAIPELGDQLEAFGIPPDEALALLHPEGVTPPRPAMPPSPVRQEIMIGDELALTPPAGQVGVPAPLPNPANELGDQISMFGEAPTSALELTPPPGVPAPVMPAALQKKAPPKKPK